VRSFFKIKFLPKKNPPPNHGGGLFAKLRSSGLSAAVKNGKARQSGNPSVQNLDLILTKIAENERN